MHSPVSWLIDIVIYISEEGEKRKGTREQGKQSPSLLTTLMVKTKLTYFLQSWNSIHGPAYFILKGQPESKRDRKMSENLMNTVPY